MSQSASPHTQRPVGAMIGAMIVAVVVAGGWYLIGKPNDDVQPIAAPDWPSQVRAARADELLLAFAPDAVPSGWRANSASYETGSTPHFHLGFLTAAGKYVGVDESRDTVDDLVAKYVGDNATQGADVQINGRTWKTWRDGDDGDYALTWSQPDERTLPDAVVVVGRAPDTDVEAFTASLKTGTVKKLG